MSRAAEIGVGKSARQSSANEAKLNVSISVTGTLGASGSSQLETEGLAVAGHKGETTFRWCRDSMHFN